MYRLCINYNISHYCHSISTFIINYLDSRTAVSLPSTKPTQPGIRPDCSSIPGKFVVLLNFDMTEVINSVNTSKQVLLERLNLQVENFLLTKTTCREDNAIRGKCISSYIESVVGLIFYRILPSAG